MKDNEELQADHKNLKSLLNSTKLDQTRLESDFSKLKDQYQQLDITSTKLTNQCEVQIGFDWNSKIWIPNCVFFTVF